MKKGRAGTMTHDYKRHGTTTLFAALNVLDGTVIGQNMQRHHRQPAHALAHIGHPASEPYPRRWRQRDHLARTDSTRPSASASTDASIRARDRLLVLLNEDEFDVQPIGSRDEDQYGRKLRVIVRGGRSLGDQLVSEGLARTWTGRREPWC